MPVASMKDRSKRSHLAASGGLLSTEESVRDWVARVCGEGIRDLPSANVWQWAAENMYLGGHGSLVHRFYDPDLTPYTKLFQEVATGQVSSIHKDDWWTNDLLSKGGRVHEYFCMKSSQSGVTQAALNVITFLTKHLTGRGLYVIDSKEKAATLARIRLAPHIAQLCGSGVAEDMDKTGKFFIQTAAWFWEFVGSYSASAFSEKAISHCFLDDCEYFGGAANNADGNGRGIVDGIHVIDHARSRFTTSDKSFLAAFTKPDRADSFFVSEHRGGSQHRWLMPCPHCGHGLDMGRKHLNYNHAACKDSKGVWNLEAVDTLTTVKCDKCLVDIDESWKAHMNSHGYFLPKSREARALDNDPLMVPGRMSVTHNDMASPFRSVKWGKLATMLIGAEGNPAKLRFVLGNHFAVPWKVGGTNLKGANIRALCAGHQSLDGVTHGQEWAEHAVPKYARGECPFMPDAITLGVDVQGDKYKWCMVAFRMTPQGPQRALIEYGACLGQDSLLELTTNPVNHAGVPMICLPSPDTAIYAGLGFGNGGCLIDSGFRTMEIYDFCLQSGWRFMPAKGVAGIDRSSGSVVEAKTDFANGAAILRYHYRDSDVKTMLGKGVFERHSHVNPQVRKAQQFFFPHDIGEDFIGELLSESMQPIKATNGQTRMTWIHDKSMGPNDWFDALKLSAIVLWEIAGGAIHAGALARWNEEKALTSQESLPIGSSNGL